MESGDAIFLGGVSDTAHRKIGAFGYILFKTLRFNRRRRWRLFL
jgi:hypothetical protein